LIQGIILYRLRRLYKEKERTNHSYKLSQKVCYEIKRVLDVKKVREALLYLFGVIFDVLDNVVDRVTL